MLVAPDRSLAAQCVHGAHEGLARFPISLWGGVELVRFPAVGNLGPNLLPSEPFPQVESDLWPPTFIFPSAFLQFEQIEKRQYLPSKKRCIALSINSTSFMLFSCLERGNHRYNAENLNPQHLSCSDGRRTKSLTVHRMCAEWVKICLSRQGFVSLI